MRLALLTTFLLACGGPTTASVKNDPEPTGPFGCGNGQVEGDEACDDGNAVGGDGCTERCVSEDGILETEPNDPWGQATTWDGSTAHGTLEEGDVDCWAIETPQCGSLTVQLVGHCSPEAVLTLHDPTGVAVATGTPDADGCAIIDPFVSIGATQVPGGTHAVCVSGLLGAAVPSYAIEASVDPSGAGFPGNADDDLDGDGLPDRCDDDRDADGVPDELDNCPDIPNGPDMGPLDTSNDGFIREWLAIGPITGTTTVLDCRPADDQITGDDANAAPELGDVDGGLTWVAWYDDDDRINLRSRFGFVDPDREAYTFVYVYSAAQQDVTLAVGADDGVFAWVNGVQVLDISSCQGTNEDQFQAPVTLLQGWNRLMVKVRDHGGGWGLYARFLDAGGLPITDLELSLTGAGAWLNDQGDMDGDGIGDVCDDEP